MKLNKSKQTMHRLLAFMLTVSVLMSVFAALPLPVFAADPDETFSSGAVLIDSSYNGQNILIKNGVFSVTVSGATNVNIIFDSVTMDRRYASDKDRSNNTIDGLYNVADKLGWKTGNTYYAYAQTCPLLLTNGASATVAFRGENKFYAGTNRCRVYSNNTYSAANNGGGFAGIQVDSGSTLTIAQSNGIIKAFGAFYVDGDNSQNYNYNYSYPDGVKQNELAGGAGIGGGAAWDTETSASSSYTAGTPGTIIINGGNIEAYGGHEAAGIGGGLNGAATSTSITINGGNVFAYGGRWAAGIGDGDSLQTNWADQYAKSYQIVINGGTVSTVGGVGCPGIGSTDEISSLTAKMDTSGLEIKINGGTVTAKSGYPDKFNPGGTTGYAGTDAAAAIGAGNKTNMASNSISIASAAKVIASGFGHYAITENGTEHDAVPTVNIDSSGYMFLGRFPTLASYEERIFKLYEEQRFDKIIDERSYQYTKYTTQPTKQNIAPEIYYFCPEAPNNEWLLKADTDGSIENATVVPITDAKDLEDKTEELALALYVDDNSVLIDTVTAPEFFRSIAISLPKPEEHGGIYALRIPIDSMYGYEGDAELPVSGYIIVTIDAREQGTISGELVYPSKFNIAFDSVSETIEDLDIYRDGQHTDGRNGLIGSAFMESVFAYTVYIEHTDTKAYIFAKSPISENFDTLIEGIGVNITRETSGTDILIYGEIDMSNVTETTVRLKKTDSTTSGRKLGSIVYKITIIKKASYKIELKNADKIYDGIAVRPVIDRLCSSEDANDEYTPTADELNSVEYTYYKMEGTSPATQLDSAPKNAGTYSVTAKISAATYTAESDTIAFTISQRTLTVSRIENALTYVSAKDYASWTATHPITDPGKIYLTDIVGNDDVTASAESVSYNDITIGYKTDKITVSGITLSGADADNYTTDPVQKVFGQISYSLDGAIFRKKIGLAWDKFYPIDSETPVNGTSADYHSPANNGVYDAHCEYVYARTENRGKAQSVYAVDIEFGAMYFSYSKSQWNPDTLVYDELQGESRWNGFDGSNNLILIKNRSNSEVVYAVNCKIDFIHSSLGDSTTGIKANIYSENSSDSDRITSTKSVPAATPGDSENTGQEGVARCYVILSGVPQLAESDHFTVVGSLTVTISR